MLESKIQKCTANQLSIKNTNEDVRVSQTKALGCQILDSMENFDSDRFHFKIILSHVAKSDK